MGDRSRFVLGLYTATLAAMLGGSTLAATQDHSMAVPALWGQGAKHCAAYLAVLPRPGVPPEIADEEYRLYRQWLAGLVTGLNLAVGRDVLAGGDLEAAMQRIGALCEQRPQDDFFNVSLHLIRALGQVQGESDQAPR